jgi:hypothetical protein
MKTIAFLICLFFQISTICAQQPFEKYGYKVKVATLSNGKFVETFDQDTLAQIGSVVINRRTGKIVSFVTYDTTYSEATLQPELISRWMSPDPLADFRWSVTPYNFVQNNPVSRIDPDGLLDDYAMDTETGNIQLIKKTDDKHDKLVDAKDNTTVIADKVDKGLLKDGQNIKENGLETSNVKGGLKLVVNISMYTNEEVSGAVYKNGDDKFLSVQPYKGQTLQRDKAGNVVGMNSGASIFDSKKTFTSADGSFTGEISSYFHTHPGHPQGPTLGFPKPSDTDEINAIDNKVLKKIDITYFIYAKYRTTYGGATSNTGMYKVKSDNSKIIWRLSDKSWDDEE